MKSAALLLAASTALILSAYITADSPVLTLLALAFFLWAVYELGFWGQLRSALRAGKASAKYLLLPGAEILAAVLISGLRSGFVFSFGELFLCAAISLREELASTFGFMLFLSTAFRGGKNAVLKSVLICSAAFGLMHLMNVPVYVDLFRQGAITSGELVWASVMSPLNAFFLGLYIKSVYAATGSISLCFMIHFLLNLSRRDLPLWGSELSVPAIIIAAVLYAAAAAVILRHASRKAEPQ